MLLRVVFLLVVVTAFPSLAEDEAESLFRSERQLNESRGDLGDKFKEMKPAELYDGETLDGGDVKLTKAQRLFLYSKSSRAAFGGTYRYADPWAKGVVPYTFKSGDFYASTRSLVEESMRVIEADTCIKFVKRSNEEDYIQIQDDGSGCNSYLGNVHKKNQPLNLANNGCLQFGTYLHELGHALGMLHEHQLPTRDDFVHYYKKNVDPANIDQLKKYSSHLANLHGTGYDLSSVMHYELTAFSKDRVSQTLGVGNTFWEPHIGRRYSHMLSFGDVKTLNKMYKCANGCGGKKCEGEQAFLNKDCECVTPESYYAKYCKDDPAQVSWCEGKAKAGKCVRSDDYMQTHCTKTCDFCPKFLPGQSGLAKPTDLCVNQYSYDEACDRWAKEGSCEYYDVWMPRHCRKSCDARVQTCSKNIGRCANRLSDSECEGYAHHWIWDYCGSSKAWGVKARKQCPDSCKLCPDKNGIIRGK